MAELNLIRELELAVSLGEDDRRDAALAYTTDLLIAGRVEDNDELWTFGEVIGLLASEIEASARAQLAERLAVCTTAPSNIMDRLATDDVIDVARPVLQHSQRISAHALTQVAQTKSQEHLLAISQRSSLNENITDVLLARGNRDVAHSVAKNRGARFSESGFWNLVQRCENDVVLTLEVGARRDIPRQHFQKLIAKATDEAKTRLAASNPQVLSYVYDVVTDVAGTIHSRFGPATREYFAAKRHVAELRRAGELTEEALRGFARDHKFEEVIATLALFCDLPVNVIERALQDDHGEMILILARSAELSWPTAKLLRQLRTGDTVSEQTLEEARHNFTTLSVATAQQVTAFYRKRQEASGSAMPERPRLLR